MTSKPKPAPGYIPNPGFTQQDWDEVSDNPELSDEEIANLRPASEVLPPALFEAFSKRRPGQRGPGKRPAKVAVTLRLDPEVIDAFKAEGEGWQTRMNDVLKRSIKA